MSDSLADWLAIGAAQAVGYDRCRNLITLRQVWRASLGSWDGILSEMRAIIGGIPGAEDVRISGAKSLRSAAGPWAKWAVTEDGLRVSYELRDARDGWRLARKGPSGRTVWAGGLSHATELLERRLAKEALEEARRSAEALEEFRDRKEGQK